MFSRNHLSELTDSLTAGFFADRAVLALARAKKRGRLDESERPIVEDILEFFHNALQGSEWTDKPKFTTESVASAEAFSRALRALPDVRSSEAFKSYVQQLMQIAESVKVSDSLAEQDVDALIQFFTRYGQDELQRTDDLINPKNDLRVPSWTPGKAFGS